MTRAATADRAASNIHTLMRSRHSGFPLRRYFSPWLMWLALLVPIAQSAAAVHAVSHIASEARNDEGKSSAPLADHCPQCLLAATLGSGAPPAEPAAWTAATTLRHAAPASIAEAPAARGGASAYLSRAPPFLA